MAAATEAPAVSRASETAAHGDSHTHMYVFRYHWSLCIDEQDGLLLRIITASRKIKLAVLRARSES
jgi:hypothetical protein